jgi:acyl-CoA thioesterase
MTDSHHAHGHRPDPQTVAEAVRRKMFENDHASKSLGMQIEAISPGYARVTMAVRNDMLNGFGLCHGGIITTLADTAFAFACNSHNELTLASGIFIEILNPGHEGDRLLAEAREVTINGRLGLYDITVTNQHGKQVALMRGRSHTMKGKHIVDFPHS